MLEYLVTSRTRRRLLDALWVLGERGSVSDLARLARVSFRGAHKELNAMHEAGLAARSCVGTATVFEADAGHPRARVLRELLRRGQGREGASTRDAREDQNLRSWMKAWGAPLSARPAAGARPPLERVLARAAALAHRDASVARSLPVFLWRNRSRLDFEQLRGEAQREGEKQTLGFFLELAGVLGNDPELRARAEGFRDHRVRRDRYFFFETRSALARRLARERTPAVARKWHLLMNLSQETFASTFEKFRTDAEVSG